MDSAKKTTTIYGISTTHDEIGNSSIKCYCSTYDIALREAKNYCDWYSSSPVNKEHIVPIKVIIAWYLVTILQIFCLPEIW